jgi:hypothetical protein
MRRTLTNQQTIQRLHNHASDTIYGHLRTARGEVQVTIARKVAINILAESGRANPCLCRFAVREGKGYLHRVQQDSK